MIPVILSGGSGTRLWPVSRNSYPKQFCEFYDQSFLTTSIERVRGFGEPYILTVESMEALTKKSMKQMGLSEDRAIFEPLGKNTAPAVALMTHVLSQQGQDDEVVGIFPADHLIAEQEAFVQAVRLGEKMALKGEVVTLGIQPRHASTGYGYIEVQDEIVDSDKDFKAHLVEGFREKPDSRTAEKFLASGHHYWNAGMFIFQVKVMKELFKKHMPETWKRIATIKPDLSNAKYAYANVENLSFDYGIMEKLERQVCIPCSMGWSDVGSWDELSRLQDEYPHLQNSDSLASVFLENSSSNYVFTIRNKVIGLIGVDNMIVVDTPDALLISKKGESQKVKDIVGQVKKAGLPEATEHPFETRPWGRFEVMGDKKNFKTKSITVDPGEWLSYQSHEKREEHWIIIEGEPEVILDGESKKLKAGDYIRIPQGAKHRMGNPGKTPVIFVEVQTGQYFGEDDIKRYEDKYNRG